MTIRGILEILKNEIDSLNSQYETLSNGVFFLKGGTFNALKNYTVMEINNILYDGKVSFGEELSCKYIRDLQNVDYQSLSQPVTIPALQKLNIEIEALIDINSIIEKSISTNFSKRDRNIVYERIAMGRTLEAVGQDFGLTRERVRQIEKKY